MQFILQIVQFFAAFFYHVAPNLLEHWVIAVSFVDGTPIHTEHVASGWWGKLFPSFRFLVNAFSSDGVLPHTSSEHFSMFLF